MSTLFQYRRTTKMTNQLTVDQLVKAVEQWSIDKGLDGTIFKIITDYENYAVSNTGDVIRLEYRDKKEQTDLLNY